MVDARLSGNKRGKSVVTVPFLTASLLGNFFSDMVRVGSNPGGPKRFSPWNYFRFYTGGKPRNYHEIVLT